MVFVQFKVYGFGTSCGQLHDGDKKGQRGFRRWMLNCTSNKDGWREVVLTTWWNCVAELKCFFYSTRTTFTFEKPQTRPCWILSSALSASCQPVFIFLCFFFWQAFNVVILCTLIILVSLSPPALRTNLHKAVANQASAFQSVSGRR